MPIHRIHIAFWKETVLFILSPVFSYKVIKASPKVKGPGLTILYNSEYLGKVFSFQIFVLPFKHQMKYIFLPNHNLSIWKMKKII